MAFSVVQFTVFNCSGNPTATLNGVTAGNALVFLCNVFNATSLSGVSDSQGSYAQLAAVAGTGTNVGGYGYGLTNATAGTHTITVSSSSGGSWGGGVFAEISGVDKTNAFDVGIALSVLNGSYTATTDGLSCGALNTTADGDFIVAFMAPNGTNDLSTVGTGYVLAVNSTAATLTTHLYVETKTQTTHGSITPTFSPTGTGDSWGTVALALKAPVVLPPVQWLPVPPGPGISPDKRAMFSARPLSAQIVPPSMQGLATWQACAFGQLTGVLSAPMFGFKPEPGPGISPAYERTFERRALSTTLPITAPLTGIAFGSAYCFGGASGIGALTGLALGQGTPGQASLTGAGALTGLASAQGVGFGNAGSGVLTNITGVAFGSAYAYASIQGAGALTGVASGEAQARATLTGAAALAGVAAAQGYTFGSLGGSGSLTGVASGQGHTFATLIGQGALQGRAAGEGRAYAGLAGAGALSGAAIGQSAAYGTVTGVGALTGIASGQGFALGAMLGVAQIQGVAIGQSHALGLALSAGAGQMQGVAAAFSFAYGGLTGLGHAFGWATVTALSQNGLPVARACYIEESASRVTASFFDASGIPFVPSVLRYRIDDVSSGAAILDWANLVPEVSIVVVVTSAENAMISLSRSSESHQVLFEITDGFGNVFYTDVSYDVIRVAGLA